VTTLQGDMILEANGVSFLRVLHKEAVKIITSSPTLVLRVRNVGKVHSSYMLFLFLDYSSKLSF
jgi:hypothetical protein